MRITGGRYKGRTVDCPKGDLDIRPSMDRMRECIFMTLGDLSGLSFLDLFAGSGIIGAEAASRGADPVLCIEKDARKLRGLISGLSFADPPIECRAMPAERFLLRPKRSFDIVFADPPFPYRFRYDLMRSIGNSGVLKAGGMVLIHFPSEDPLPEEIGDLRLKDKRVFGRSIVQRYERREAADGEDGGLI